MRRVIWAHWGAVPATPRADGVKRPLLINARGETADRLPTFRNAFSSNRCLILADGFYEWKRSPGPKPQPYFFHRANNKLLLLAGLELAGEPGGCVVITTEANSLMHAIHDRMPVIFDSGAARVWLSPDSSRDTLRAILQPLPSSDMACHPVSDRVNRSTSDGESLIEPVVIREQQTLF
jgi:putative SOS response-associated peptidase YedK